MHGHVSVTMPPSAMKIFFVCFVSFVDHEIPSSRFVAANASIAN
jgi:hypothetical protein